MQKAKRQLTVYEKNQLLKHGFSLDQIDLEQLGEKPIEYFIGQADFAGRTFLVNQHVLIPRVETEELLDLIVDYLKRQQLNRPVKIIEIGTGSGCIGITLALTLEKLAISYELILVDISQSALDLAQKNWQSLQPKILKSQLKFQQSDLLEQFTDQQFDLVVANLPYIPTSDLQALDLSVKGFEPILALDGGVDGKFLINQLLNQAQTQLKANGKIFLEIYETMSFPEWTHQYEIEYYIDQFGKRRFARLAKITDHC